MDILAVTTQAREGIETFGNCKTLIYGQVTTQAREVIETLPDENLGRSGRVTTQAHEGIETSMSCNKQHLESRNNSSPRGH